MAIKENKIIIKWNSSNKKWYESKKYIYTKMGEEFEIDIKDISKGSSSIITAICDCCGKESITMEYASYIHTINRANGIYRCKNCAREKAGKSMTMPILEIENKLLNIYNGKIKIIKTSYINTQENAQFYCIECGCVWSTSPNNILINHTNCPDCAKGNTSEMKAKIFLKRWLNLCRYKIISQKTFEDLKINNYPLRYDFCIEDKETKSLYLIELQGEQHFNIVDFSGKKSESEKRKEFEAIQNRDKMKKEYVNNNNNLTLIYIDYTKYKNMETNLKNTLLNYNIEFVEIPNNIKNYNYIEKFRIAENIRQHKFILNQNISRKELARLYKVEEIFNIKESTSEVKVAEILNGRIMYEDSKYKKYMDEYKMLSRQSKVGTSNEIYFSEEDELKICNLYKQGMSIDDICTNLNIKTRNIIKRVLKKNNIEIRDRMEKILQTNYNSKLDIKKVQVIRDLLKKQILSVNEIAEKFSVKPNVIYKIKLNKTWKNIN